MSIGSLPNSAINGILLLLLLLLLFFGFLIPDAKAKKSKARFQANLKVGDKVFTAAGIYGTVTGVAGDLVTIKTAETDTLLEMGRWALTDPAGGEPGKLRMIELNHKDG
jgi:preprotein translocase YajC subunit